MKNFWKTKRKAFLRNLKIEEISGVDAGDNPSAHVLFMKHNPNEKENDMDLKEFLKKFTDVEKVAGETATTLAEVQKANERLAALAGMSDAEKSFMKSLPEDQREAFIKADDTVRADQMAKEEEDKKAAEAAEAGKDNVTKAIEKATNPIAKSLTEANALIKKLTDERDLAEFEKSFDKRLPNFGGKPEEKTELLKSLKAMPEDQRELVLKQMENADKVMKSYFREGGTSHRGSDDPQTQLDALAKSYAEKNDVSVAKAMKAVCKTADGSALYNAINKQTN